MERKLKKDNQKKVLVRMYKNLHIQIQVIADVEKRSVNEMINYLLSEKIKERRIRK